MTKKKKMIYFQDIFASLGRWEEVGFLSRAIEEFYIYSDKFDISYIVTNDVKRYDFFPKNITHIPLAGCYKFNKIIYFFLAGSVIQTDVDYVEISGTTAIVPAIIYRFLGKRIFLYHKWDLSYTLRTHNQLILSYIARIINICAFNVADIIAVTTTTLGNDVKKYTKCKKIYLLPNFIDCDLFKPNPTIPKEANTLIFVGRLHRDKNLFMLLDAMKNLPQFKLSIIGEGPLKNELKSYLKKMNIKNVTIVGRVEYQDLPQYLNKSEVFILVSHTEGHPKVLLEAMSCGIPCIGTNVRGINDIIVNNKNGLLCNKTSKDIEVTIKKMFSNRTAMHHMGKNGRTFIIGNLSKEKIMNLKIKLITGDLENLKPIFDEARR